MQEQSSFNKWLLRGFIVVGWLTLIFGFLWMPRMVQRVAPRTINVLSWTELIDRAKVTEFEQKTGIKVNIGYYESNNELFVKLKVSKATSYDLLVPSDYMVASLIKEQLVQRLDRNKLTFWHRLNPRLLGHYYDPANEYSIPYVWSIYGLGVNKRFFNGQPKASWSLLFNFQQLKGPVVMLEDAVEAILCTSKYLFGDLVTLNDEHMERIKQLLLEQKKYVIAYTDMGAPYLLASDQCAVALTTNPYVTRLIDHYPYLDFIIPEEGTFMAIDNLVIPALSTKQELVYQFINFLYESEVMKFHLNKNKFLSPLIDVSVQQLPISSSAWLNPDSEHFAKLRLLRTAVSLEAINQVWLALKSS